MSWSENQAIGKKLKRLPDISAVAVDIHSHLIPGIDDGAKTIEESLKLIRQLHSIGYKKLITTPHINSRFRNSSDIIRAGLDKLRNAVEYAGIDIAIDAAAEYQIDDNFELLFQKKDLLTFGKNYLLIELEYHFQNPQFSQTVYDLQLAGYNVVLAHVERYSYWHRKPEEFEKLKAREVMLQINFMSLNIFNPISTRKTAQMLIDAGMVDFVGTDVHNDLYMKLMLRGMRNRYAHKLIASETLKNSTLL